MFYSAATKPGNSDSPNEDWVAISPTVVIVLDGVTVQKEFQGSCNHGTPWYVRQLGTKLLVEASDPEVSLSDSLRIAISGTASLHADECQLDQIGAPSAAVAVLRMNEYDIEYLVLADITVLIKSNQRLAVISDERVSRTVEDLVGEADTFTEVMNRRSRYRNKESGYWVAAADPNVADYALVGRVSNDGFDSAAIMSDGVSRLVMPFEQTDWRGLLAQAQQAGPDAVIETVREVEASDRERKRWPRFKVSDDATLAFIAADPRARA
jgi:antitoxin component HigA of HigAB toxin-antitoxin module